MRGAPGNWLLGPTYTSAQLIQRKDLSYAMAKTSPEWAFGNGTLWDTALGWRFPNAKLKEMHGHDSMGETAENVYDLTAAGRY